MSEILLNQAPAPDLPGSERGQSNWSKIAFTGTMLVLTALFLYLGQWQLNRLAEKEALISAVEERIGDAPISLPPAAEWIAFDALTYNFRPLKVTGTFDHKNSVLVFTFLADQNGPYSGPGYWVMVPLKLSGGGTVFVNRGFVPEAQAEEFKTGGAGPVGEVTITGLGRVSEQANAFTPGSEFSNRVEWVRNIDRLSRFVDTDMTPLAPIYINADAGESGALPQGGETRITFPNRHFSYALTWFSLAATTPLMLIFWLVRGRRKRDVT